VLLLVDCGNQNSFDEINKMKFCAQAFCVFHYTDCCALFILVLSIVYVSLALKPWDDYHGLARSLLLLQEPRSLLAKVSKNGRIYIQLGNSIIIHFQG